MGDKFCKQKVVKSARFRGTGTREIYSTKCSNLKNLYPECVDLIFFSVPLFCVEDEHASNNGA